MKVGIINVTGYSGSELARILRRHPEVEIASVTGRSAAGQRLGEVFPHLDSLDLTIEPELSGSLDLVFSFGPAPQGQRRSLHPGAGAGRQGGGHQRRLPPETRRRIRRMVRRGASGAVAAGGGGLRPDRTAPRRNQGGAAGSQPRLLPHQRHPGPGPGGGRRASSAPTSSSAACRACRAAGAAW